jgi:hypothetical protein
LDAATSDADDGVGARRRELIDEDSCDLTMMNARVPPMTACVQAPDQEMKPKWCSE